MAVPVFLQHPQSGLRKTGYIGFSWTSFFFSGIPAMMRGDIPIGLGVLLASVFLGTFSFGLLLLIVNLVWAFKYNTMYTTKLIENGYRIADDSPNAAKAREVLGLPHPDFRPQTAIAPQAHH